MTGAGTSLAARIESREATVAIIGLGYVGLPLAITFAEAGFRVFGLDIDEAKVAALRSGQSYIDSIASTRIRALVEDGRLRPTTDFEVLDQADVIEVCVPTPLTAQAQPDMRFVNQTTDAIASRMRPAQLVILVSTTYPGTTEEMHARLLASGEVPEDEFFVAYAPEREDPGNRNFATLDIPKVIGGRDSRSGELATSLYRNAGMKVVPMRSARAAEATKLTENIFRAVNIALVNELKVVFDAMGVDVWEVLDAAATKPFGFMRFEPGPGWGGHCIPVDPFYLSWKAREYGVATKFIERAGEVNADMPHWVVRKLQSALNARRTPMNGARILILGLAYKRDVGDCRESPAFEIIDALLRQGARVRYHDPHVPEAPHPRGWPELPAMHSVALETGLDDTDAVVIVTDHAGVDYDLVLERAPLIIDSRGTFRHRRSEKVIPA